MGAGSAVGSRKAARLETAAATASASASPSASAAPSAAAATATASAAASAAATAASAASAAAAAAAAPSDEGRLLAAPGDVAGEVPEELTRAQRATRGMATEALSTRAPSPVPRSSEDRSMRV